MIFIILYKTFSFPQGCGFGFRYKHLPDVIPVKHLHSEISMAKLQGTSYVLPV